MLGAQRNTKILGIFARLDSRDVLAQQQSAAANVRVARAAIDTAQANLTSAQSNVISAQLQAQADLHPQTPEQIAQARHQLRPDQW